MDTSKNIIILMFCIFKSKLFR